MNRSSQKETQCRKRKQEIGESTSFREVGRARVSGLGTLVILQEAGAVGTLGIGECPSQIVFYKDHPGGHCEQMSAQTKSLRTGAVSGCEVTRLS